MNVLTGLCKSGKLKTCSILVSKITIRLKLFKCNYLEKILIFKTLFGNEISPINLFLSTWKILTKL